MYHLHLQGRKSAKKEGGAQQVARCLLHADFFLGWFSTLKMEKTRYSEMSVHIRAAWHYAREGGNIHNYLLVLLIISCLSSHRCTQDGGRTNVSSLDSRPAVEALDITSSRVRFQKICRFVSKSFGNLIVTQVYTFILYVKSGLFLNREDQVRYLWFSQRCLWIILYLRCPCNSSRQFRFSELKSAVLMLSQLLKEA
jgi:hypothetical protein